MNRKTRWLAGLAVGVVVVALAAAALTRGRFAGRYNALDVDLSQPDLLVRSARLGALSKDLVAAPLLRDILTEDFVHYYEDHPTRLSLLGTLKRLAYDHPLSWSDRLIAAVLDAPAELALWRDGKGRPSHFVLLLEHNLAAEAVLQLAKVGLPDKQLSVAGELGSALGPKSTVYAVKLNARTTWLFVSQGGRTLVASDPGLLLEADGGLSRRAAAVLADAIATAPGAVSPFARDFDLGTRGDVAQQIAAKTSYLSFGYQHFFPELGALRLDLDARGHWSLAAHASGAALEQWGLGAAQLWRTLPRSSALCASLPVDVSRAEPMLEMLGGKAGGALAADLLPVAAVCWGPQGGLFAPMLALRLREGVEARHDETLAQVLQQATADPAKPAAADGDDDGETRPAAREARTPQAPSPVHTQTLKQPNGARLWTRTVAHEHGAVPQGPQRVNVVAVARLGSLLVASTDLRAVEQTLAVAAKTYPALSDTPVDGAVPVLFVDGARLAGVLETETWRTLKPAAAPTFNRVARELLTPRLQAVGRLGTLQIGLPSAAPQAKGPQWVPLAVHRDAAAGGTGQPAKAAR